MSAAQDALCGFFPSEAAGVRQPSPRSAVDVSEDFDHPRPPLPATLDPLLQFFSYSHLPADLQVISREFYALAMRLTTVLPRNAERTVALRKLLEAKDSAVRAVLYQPLGNPP